MIDLNENRIMTLPVLPVRGACVFPSSAFHFDVERALSMAAINAAIDSDRLIFLDMQKDITIETPTANDLCGVGTVCRISQVLRSPTGGTAKCIVDGLYRAKLLRVTAEEPCLWANVQILADRACDASTVTAQASMRTCNDFFAEYASASGVVGTDLLLRTAESHNPSFISDFICQNIYLRSEEKQKLLEELRPLKRVNMLCDLLRRELDIIDIQQDLQFSTVDKMNSHQKEYYLREQMDIIRKELGEEDDDTEALKKKILALKLPEESEKKLLKEVDNLAKQPFGSAESSVLRSHIDICLELPWNTKSKVIKDLARAEKILNEDHYGLKKVKERVLEFLAVQSRCDKTKASIICLVGPPGVGKTSIAMSVARATGRKLGRISLGGIHDEAEIRGHRKTYVGAMPGRIIEGIRTAGSSNPVLVLDEIDKLGSDFRGDPSAALLEALDGEQNFAFRDHFIEIPFDLSDVFFITTANSLDTIPHPLLDRMEIIEIPGYTDEEKCHIAKDYLLPKQRKNHGLNARQLKLDDDALCFMIRDYTREAGVRLLEREIAAVCRKTAMVLEKEEAKSVHVKNSDLEKYLGPVKNKDQGFSLQDHVGLVHGLAWTSAGGEVLDIECATVPGSGKIELTGNLGDVMKESCHAAVTYIRSRTDMLGIDSDFYKNTDIHLHFPEGAVPKDGPSAGGAICLCVISALTGKPVRGDIAMTGEITLRGRILPIGGIQEKSMAALREGIHYVLLPQGNVADLAEIDEDVKNAIQYHPITHMDEILQIAFRQNSEIVESKALPKASAKKINSKEVSIIQ